MGTCYYCGKEANEKARLLHEDIVVFVCKFHLNEVKRIENRKGMGAGIG